MPHFQPCPKYVCYLSTSFTAIVQMMEKADPQHLGQMLLKLQKYKEINNCISMQDAMPIAHH